MKEEYSLILYLGYNKKRNFYTYLTQVQAAFASKDWEIKPWYIINKFDFQCESKPKPKPTSYTCCICNKPHATNEENKAHQDQCEEEFD